MYHLNHQDQSSSESICSLCERAANDYSCAHFTKQVTFEQPYLQEQQG